MSGWTRTRRAAFGIAVLGALSLALTVGLAPGVCAEPSGPADAPRADTGTHGQDPAPDPADPSHAATREIMGGLLDSLQVLLWATADDSRFSDPAQKPRIDAAAKRLAAGAAALTAHTEGPDGAAAFVSQGLARDAADIERNLERGEIRRAEYLVHRITDNCIACHARLPGRSSPRAERFMESEVLAALPLDERAQLQIATRRFDDALDTLEALLRSPDVGAELLVEPLVSYLTVAVRVKGDFARPIPVLRRFAERPDVWRRLRSAVETWIAALEGMPARLSPAEQLGGAADLALARALVGEARGMALVRSDRSATLHALVASAALARFVENPDVPSPDRAEAYYLLGVIDVYAGVQYWMSPADFYLSKAIELAPTGPFAEDAFALLEEQILLDYEGSDEEAIPPAEAKRLKRLRDLIDVR